MKKEDYKVGDRVIISWKEDEGGGWYSNKKRKGGVVFEDETGTYILTNEGNKVHFNDLTAIKLI